jgi:predicted transcriptional regulator
MKHMTLNQWCERDGRHLSDIAAEFGISLSQLYRLLSGEGTRKATAIRIQAITGGKVRAATLLGVDA